MPDQGPTGPAVGTGPISEPVAAARPGWKASVLAEARARLRRRGQGGSPLSGAEWWLLTVVAIETALVLAICLPPILSLPVRQKSGSIGSVLGLGSVVLVPVVIHALWRAIGDHHLHRERSGEATEGVNALRATGRDWLGYTGAQGILSYTTPTWAQDAWNGSQPGFDGTGLPLRPGAGQAVAGQHTKERITAALNQNMLVTAFQPICRLDSGEVVGAEALTRFTAHPIISPAAWFSEAAAVGLGADLELRALKKALNAALQLPEYLYVSVNLSPFTCLDPRTENILLQSPLPAFRIVLELTEQAPVPDYTSLARALQPLRRAGVRIAIDDTGAGFASMRHVLELKPELIKLDRTIISGIDTDPGRYALVAAFVLFAAQTGASIIAEGIETEGALDAATALGSAFGQGFLLGHPTTRSSEWTTWQ